MVLSLQGREEMKNLIAFNRNKIYTSLDTPDYNPSDDKLKLLLKLTHELGKFGYILDQDALLYLSENDIVEYAKTVLPILYDLYYHKKYSSSDSVIDLEDWKSRRGSDIIENFYISGDFKFIYESSNNVNHPISYLKRMTDDDLYDIYLKITSNKSNPGPLVLNELKYLAELFKDKKVEPKNLVSTLVVSLWNLEIRPKNLSDYSILKPNRCERRLILNKLNNLDLEKENRSDLKKLFKILHPGEYKKIFPRVYEYMQNLNKKKEEPAVSQSLYSEGLGLLNSGKIEEFDKRFIGLLFDSIIDSKTTDDEVDIMTLLYSEKLKTSDLLFILNRLHFYELSIPRYFDNIYVLPYNKFVAIVPTVKEFLFNSMALKVRDESVKGKTVYINPELKRYDFGSTKKGKKITYFGKLDIKDTLCLLEYIGLYGYRCNHINCYVWKGPGKMFKSIPANSNHIVIDQYKDLGYRYFVFNSVKTKNFIKTPITLRILSGKSVLKELEFKSECRNNFGGMIDLKTNELYILDFDLNELPTFNGNIHEAIVRYIIPEFRFSAYDFFTNYFTSSGATIVDDPKNCNIHFTENDYKKFKIE